MVGGIERYVLDLATGQARRGEHVDITTLRRDVLGVHLGPLAGRDDVDGVRITRLPGFGNQRFGLCLRPDRLVRSIRRADVVHIHDLRYMLGLVAIVARLTRRPLIFHTHGLLAHTTFASGLKRLLLRSYYGPMLRLGRATIIASSANDRRMLLEDVPHLGARTRTFLNAIDLETYLAIEPDPTAGRLLVIGRVAERKGIDRLLAALAAMQRRGAAAIWSVVIAGTDDPVERLRLEAMVERLGLGASVRFLGEYTDAEHRTLLAGAHAAVFPSRAEGFGLALLEAMAAGVPLIASDIPPHRALLSSTPDLLVDFDDPEAGADALIRVLGLDADGRSVIAGRLRAAARSHGIDRLLGEIDALYRDLGLPG